VSGGWLYQPIMNDWKEMLAASSAVRSFLQVPNSTQDTMRAIFQKTANEAAVPVQSVTDGAAGSASFTIAGNHSRVFVPGSHCRFIDQLDFDGLVTVSAVAFDAGVTTVSVREALAAVEIATLKVKPQECPRIIISSEGLSATKNSQSNGDFFVTDGTLWAMFEWEPDATYYDPSVNLDDPQGAAIAFGELVSEALCDLKGMAGSGKRSGPSGRSWLDFGQFTVSIEPEEVWRPCDNNGRPFWVAEISCQLGGGD